MKRLRLIPALLLAFAFGLASAASPTPSPVFFRLNADRLWLRAEALPLADLLDLFSRAGVDVFAPTNLSGSVSGSLAGVDVSEGLGRILSAHDYLLRWRRMPSPVGPVPRLASIRVIPRSDPDAPTPRWTPRSAPLRPSRGVSGSSPEFAADELLLSLRVGTSWPAFSDLLDQLGGTLLEVQGPVCRIRFPPNSNIEAILLRLRSSPLVARAQPNYIYRSTECLPAASVPMPPAPPPGAVPVAVLDSGVDPASPAAPLLSAAWNALSPEAPLADSSGHGTQMALLAAGAQSPDGWTPPDASNPVVGLRVFDAQGATTDFTILQALAYAKQAGARVVNMSWGSETESPFLQSALAAAAADGLILVAASGNEGSSTPRYPAAYPGVLAVAGLSSDGSPWPHSSTGPHVALSAPATSTALDPDGRLVSWSGTSVSAAAVSSALARYLSAHPEASAADAVAALLSALDPLPPDASGLGAGALSGPALARLLE